MKTLLIVCFILTGLFSDAQFKTPASKFNFNYDFLRKDNLVTASGLVTFPKATFSIQNSVGKIYALPADKMPCLVPDTKLITPIPNKVKPFTYSLMLNPYKNEELIPVQ